MPPEDGNNKQDLTGRMVARTMQMVNTKYRRNLAFFIITEADGVTIWGDIIWYDKHGQLISYARYLIDHKLGKAVKNGETATWTREELSAVRIRCMERMEVEKDGYDLTKTH